MSLYFLMLIERHFSSQKNNKNPMNKNNKDNNSIIKKNNSSKINIKNVSNI